MKDLEAHLAAKVSEGSLIDQGTITLNPENAMKKLGLHALAEPALWLVKLVQAAVAADADRIDISMSRKKVTVVFDNRLNWKADDVLQLLTAGKLSQDRASSHLVFGLLSALGLPGTKVSWSCGGERIDYANGDIKRTSAPSSHYLTIESTRPIKTYKISQHGSTPVSHLFKMTADEYKILWDRCFACPIPIYIDGLKLPRSYERPTSELPESGDYDSESQDGEKFRLAMKPVCLETGRPTLAYPLEQVSWTDDSPYTDDGKHFKTQIWKADSKPVHGVLCMYFVRQRDSQIVYLWDGALLERKAVRHPQLHSFRGGRAEGIPFQLYLEVSPAEVDIGQFKVRESDQDQVIASVAEELKEMMSALRASCFRDWKLKPAGQYLQTSKIVQAALWSIAIPLCVIFSPLLLMVQVMNKQQKMSLDKLLASATEELEIFLAAEK